ncbi:thioredoxin domain-containing protein [Candidatus Saccharibacteria bacterium]|nr:thioredoxin domain-containing protein [Candidatus Saccharibacteria bacterium]
MDKRFWLIVTVIVVAFGGVLLLNSKDKEKSLASVTNHVTGNAQSDVTILEYGDYQCSACGAFFPTVQQVKEKYASTVKFQFRNLPLVQPHPNAFAAARAAEAADLQGKFWEMHDLLYENQDQSGASGWVASKDPLSDYFATYAKQLGLNVATFKTDFASTTVNDRINADMDAFTATGEQMSTPTFFLNGKKIENKDLLDTQGAPSIDSFSKVIDAALAKK